MCDPYGVWVWDGTRLNSVLTGSYESIDFEVKGKYLVGKSYSFDGYGNKPIEEYYEIRNGSLVTLDKKPKGI